MNTGNAVLPGGFNPRPRAGGDGKEFTGKSKLSGFNPRPRAGGDRVRIRSRRSYASFNPRPRAGGDYEIFAGVRQRACFNPRPRAGRDGISLSYDSAMIEFQSTPPCGGRHGLERISSRGIPVSIHAPVRGATRRSWLASGAFGSFNPRPRAGGDKVAEVWGTHGNSFNPRPRAGGDIVKQIPRCSYRSFNPRPRAGGDLISFAASSQKLQFQSTPPCGGRLSLFISTFSPASVSIHAPVRGATSFWITSSVMSSGFNPRPRAGGDSDPGAQGNGIKEFQSTPPCGGRRQ